MTTERELFPLPDFPSDKPLVEHPFYAWMLEKESTTRPQLVGYLSDIGFNVTRHRLDPDQLKTLEYVQDAYWNLWMPTREPHRLEDLFEPVHHGFWLRGHDSKVRPTSTLVELIEKAAPIYKLHHDHYCFEVTNNTLFIKYQHIIGSRRLCKIWEDSQ